MLKRFLLATNYTTNRLNSIYIIIYNIHSPSIFSGSSRFNNNRFREKADDEFVKLCGAHAYNAIFFTLKAPYENLATTVIFFFFSNWYDKSSNCLGEGVAIDIQRSLRWAQNL